MPLADLLILFVLLALVIEGVVLWKTRKTTPLEPRR